MPVGDSGVEVMSLPRACWARVFKAGYATRKLRTTQDKMLQLVASIESTSRSHDMALTPVGVRLQA